jgi:hypothetical protein
VNPGADLPVVLSLGMGLDSVAVVTRWLLDPSSRDFDLSRLTVLTAMTGEEYASTGELMVRHVLPLFRARRVRYVQLSRAGQSTKGGYTVLDDSRTPTVMHLRGPWRLSDELRATATVPQVTHGRRLCSARAKAEPLDAWIADNIGGDYIHVLGFAADEQRRIERDTTYTRNARQPLYPLAVWGWDRARCLEYLREVYQVTWERSACTFCPFQIANPAELAQRWRSEPAAAAHAVALEDAALACNPRSGLFGRTRARAFAAAHDVSVPPHHSGDWVLLEVRRIFTAQHGHPTRKGPAWRSLRCLATGDLDILGTKLASRAATAGVAVAIDGDGVTRTWLRRAAPPYPAAEHLLALAPAGPREKERAGFEALWQSLTD